MNEPTPQSTHLFYQEGASDKVYQAHLRPEGAGWVVEYAYGRRGQSLKTDFKTTGPVPYGTAKKAYDKLVQSKLAKGYTPDPEGIPYQNTPLGDRVSGVLPQLCTTLEPEEREAWLDDDRHVLQPKHDGSRVLIRTEGGKAMGINRRGLSIALPHGVAQAAAAPGRTLLLDGELLKDRHVVFDLLEIDGADLRQQPYFNRLARLQTLLPTPSPALAVVETATGAAAKRALYARLQAEGQEGAVFKDRFAAYVPGKPARGGPCRKDKFTQSASLEVTGTNGKRSVSLGLYDANGRRVPAGNVTIPANHDVPPVGATVEMRYLYALPQSGSLFQPTYLGVREDLVAEEDCVVSQLKYQATA